MAIVKGPALSLRASGNLGAICYSTWRGLAIARDVWTGTVPNTAKQVAQQVYLTAVAQAWGGSLTEGERETWNERALTETWTDRMGDPYIPSGYQLFLKWNIRRKVMGLAILITAPGSQEWVWIDLFAVQALVGQIAMRLRDFGAVGTELTSYGTEYYKAGPYDSGGRRPIDGEWRFLIRKVPPALVFDNAVVPGKWYWYRGRQVSEFGGVGNWWQEGVQAI